MESLFPTFLIVGLGNPGKEYENNRHNIGFQIVTSFAEKLGMSFQKKDKLKAFIAQGQFEGCKIYLQLPTTYMNNSGEAVRLCADYYKIKIERILVIADDIAIDLGEFRLKADSGPGGHNGLKSIEAHLQSKAYRRLRVGVGDREHGDLVSHVLGDFTKEQSKVLPQIIIKAHEIIEMWMKEGLEKTMVMANVHC